MCQAISSEPVPQLAVGAPDAPLLAPQPRHHRPLPQQAGCCNPGQIFDTSAKPFKVPSQQLFKKEQLQQ